MPRRLQNILVDDHTVVDFQTTCSACQICTSRVVINSEGAPHGVFWDKFERNKCTYSPMLSPCQHCNMPLSRVSSFLTDSPHPDSPDILPTSGGQEVTKCRTQTVAMSAQTEMTRSTAASAVSDFYLLQDESTDRTTDRTACLLPDRRMTLAAWIRYIPPEILIQIFLLCMDTNKKSPPWYLSHICRLWRDITLRTPQLWMRIPLPPLSSRVRIADALVCFMPEYLTRSKDQSIDFAWEGNWDPESLEEEDRFEDPLCGHSNTILDLLIQHAERWGKVSLVSGRWTPKLEQQLTQLRNRLLRLCHLELGVNSSRIIYTNVFQDVPNLTDVKLCTSLGSNSTELIHHFIHWRQIERLKFIIPSTCILPHLDLCRNLVELDLEYVGEETAPFGPDKLELPHLKAFGLRSPSDLSSDHFENVSFPRLEKFRVFSILGEPEPFHSFLRFLNRHRKSLRRLTIGHIHFMYFQTSRPETRINFTLLPFDQLHHLGYLQLHRPPLDKLSTFLKAIAHGSVPIIIHTLHIIFNDAIRLPHAYIIDLSDQLNAIVLWSEHVHTRSSGSSPSIRQLIINPGDSNDHWEFLAALEGWPEEYNSASSEARVSFISLRECERRLQEVYSWDYDYMDRVVAIDFDEASTRKIAECLEVMETCGVHQVCLLYSTRIHFIVRALSNLFSDQLTPAKSGIPERAFALVNEWRSLFLEDMENRRWMHRGCKKLIYVPSDDDIYRPNVEYWMYGLKPEWETGDPDDLF